MYIRTQRLELKPMDRSSLAILAELLTDETVKQTYMVPDFSAPAEAMSLAIRLMTLSEQEDRLVVGIYAGSELIGILNETESTLDYIELGYALLPRYHNRGYATEALRAAIKYCFAHGFEQVRTGAFADNPASIRVMVKCGMQKMELQEQISYRNKTHQCIYYSITKEDQHAVSC